MYKSARYKNQNAVANPLNTSANLPFSGSATTLNTITIGTLTLAKGTTPYRWRENKQAFQAAVLGADIVLSVNLTAIAGGSVTLTATLTDPDNNTVSSAGTGTSSTGIYIWIFQGAMVKSGKAGVWTLKLQAQGGGAGVTYTISNQTNTFGAADIVQVNLPEGDSLIMPTIAYQGTGSALPLLTSWSGFNGSYWAATQFNGLPFPAGFQQIAPLFGYGGWVQHYFVTSTGSASTPLPYDMEDNSYLYSNGISTHNLSKNPEAGTGINAVYPFGEMLAIQPPTNSVTVNVEYSFYIEDSVIDSSAVAALSTAMNLLSESLSLSGVGPNTVDIVQTLSEIRDVLVYLKNLSLGLAEAQVGKPILEGQQ